MGPFNMWEVVPPHRHWWAGWPREDMDNQISNPDPCNDAAEGDHEAAKWTAVSVADMVFVIPDPSVQTAAQNTLALALMLSEKPPIKI